MVVTIGFKMLRVMKRITSIFSIAVAAMAMLSSCAKTELKNDITLSDGKVYTAYSDADTKTAMDGLSTKWMSTDKVKGFVLDPDYGTLEDYVSSAPTFDPEFTDGHKVSFTFPELAEEKSLNIVIYPNSEKTAFDVDSFSGYIVNIPSEQTAVKNGFSDGAAISVAFPEEGSTELYFQNTVAFPAVIIKNDNIKKVEFEALAANDYVPARQIAGDFVLSWENPSPNLSPFYGYSGEKSSKVTLIGDFEKDGKYYFCMAPATGWTGLYDIRITFTDALGRVASYEQHATGDDPVFEINRNHTFVIFDKEIPGDKWQGGVENFSSSAATSNNYNCASNLSTADNRKDFDYTWSSGTGTVFKNGVKLGTGSASGSITSSDILNSIPDGSNFTVKVYAAVWNNDGGKLVVTYNGQDVTIAPTNAAITATTGEYNADHFTSSTDFVFKKVASATELKIASSDKRILIDKIAIVKGGITPAEFKVSTEALSAKWDDTEVTFNVIADPEVEWDIVADDGLTLSLDGGKGNASITVSFDENTGENDLVKEILVATEYTPIKAENSDLYTITLTQAGKPSREFDGEGTSEKPYSVADALYLAERLADNALTQECYVSGTVYEIKTYKNGTQSYSIGTETENLYIYAGKDLGNEQFSGEGVLKVGQAVVVIGQITKYVSEGATTLEMASGNYLYKVDGQTSILTGLAISGQKTSFAQNEAWSFGGKVSVSYRGKAEEDVTSSATFTVNGSAPSTAILGDFIVTVAYSTLSTTYTYNVYDPTAVNISKITSVTDFTAGTYIILTYDEAAYAPNAVATSGGKVTYTPVTKEAGKIKITKDMVWTATGEGKTNGLTFESYLNKGNYLWGYDNSNGIRVNTTITGSGASKVWKLTSNNTYGLIGTAGSSRYLATNGITDWRYYATSNISETNKPANFFKVTGWVPEPDKLVMSEVTVDNKTTSSVTFKWNAVTGATGYKVKVGDAAYGAAQTETTYTVSGLLANQEVTIAVVAIGDGTDYTDSDPVTCAGKASSGGDYTVKKTVSYAGAAKSAGVWQVTTNGDNPTGASATYNQTYGTLYQMTGGNEIKYTISGFTGKKITKITLSMRSNSSAGAGYYYFKAGTTTLSSVGTSSSGVAFNNAKWYGNWSTSYVNVTPDMTDATHIVASGENLEIYIKATANSLYCNKVTIEYYE